MKKKLLILTVLVLVMASVLVGCDGFGGNGSSAEGSASDAGGSAFGEVSSKNATQKFYDLVKSNQGLMDILADDLYSNWFDAIYEDRFSGDINTAILMALIDNEENINTIKDNDEKIKDLYKNNNLKVNDLCKEVIIAYSDYYEFVINVSGSFESFSAGMEAKKKALASALRNLEFDL